jgi:hypothetical protein
MANDAEILDRSNLFGPSEPIYSGSTKDTTSNANARPVDPNFYENVGYAAAGVPAAYAAHKARQAVTIPASVLRQKDSLARGSKEISGLRSVSDQMAAIQAEIQAKHDYLHGAQAIDDRLPPHLRPQPPAPEPFKVEILPRSGPGVSNYAGKYVRNPSAVLEAASMQDVQQNLVHKNEADLKRANAVQQMHSSNVSPLELTRRAIDERAQQLTNEGTAASQATEQHNKLVDEAREKIQNDLKKPRAVIAAELAKASGDATDAEAALRRKTGTQFSVANNLETELSKMPSSMQARVAKYSGDAGLLSRTASGVGRVLNKVAVPLTILQAPLSAKEAYQDLQKGNYYDAAKSGAAAAGGLLQGAALGAAMLASGPAVVGGLAAAGGALGVASLAAELPDALAYIKRESPAAYRSALSYLKKNWDDISKPSQLPK